MVGSFQGDQKDQESDEIPKNIINGGDSSSSINEGSVGVTKQEEMTELASRKHALSERKRRRRINNHFDSLRRLFPRLLKTDKAYVLSETVRCLKELKNMVAGVTLSQEVGDRWSHKRERQVLFIPSENDEVSVGYPNSGNKTIIRAIICCEDRPDLNQGLMEAIQSFHGKPVKAEMATVGGRTKVDIIVEWPKCGDRQEDVGLLRRALTAVVENKILGQTGFISHESIEPGRTEFMAHESTGPKYIGLGRRFVDGLGPNVYDQTESAYAD